MTDISAAACIATATAATSLLVLLALLRLKINGRRPLRALTRRWVTAPMSTSAGVQAILAAIALSAFAAIPEMRLQPPAVGEARVAPVASPFEADEDLAALRSYASAIDAPPHATAPAEPLPGVEEMIAKLKTRLSENPADVKGWKMLGWSYLNTGDPAAAARAYAEALKLAPADAEITAALSAAKSATAGR